MSLCVRCAVIYVPMTGSASSLLVAVLMREIGVVRGVAMVQLCLWEVKMKMVFALAGLSGRDLFNCFAEAIKEEGSGTDGEYSAYLSEDGTTWTTHWSKFSYAVLNGTEECQQAVVEYDGSFRGFLSQRLIPEELRGETSFAIICEGSAVEKHGVLFEHTDAKILAEAYGLMQNIKKAWNGQDPLKGVIAAVEAAREIEAHIKGFGWCRAGNGTTFTGTQKRDKDPSVFLTCFPGGRYVTSEFHLSVDLGEIQRKKMDLVDQARAWINYIRPVLVANND